MVRRRDPAATAVRGPGAHKSLDRHRQPSPRPSQRAVPKTCSRPDHEWCRWFAPSAIGGRRWCSQHVRRGRSTSRLLNGQRPPVPYAVPQCLWDASAAERAAPHGRLCSTLVLVGGHACVPPSWRRTLERVSVQAPLRLLRILSCVVRFPCASVHACATVSSALQSAVRCMHVAAVHHAVLHEQCGRESRDRS